MRVLVTRGDADAQPYADHIRARGAEPVIFPLYTVEPVVADMENLSPYDALTFTSAHAIHQFCALSSRRDVPVYAVGPQSAAVACGYGFSDVQYAAGTGTDLAALLNDSSGRLLYGRAEEISYPLGESLRAKGRDVQEIILYKTVPVIATALPLKIDMALFFSAGAARIFVDFVQKQGVSHNFEQTKALCLGAGMVEFLTPVPWAAIEVADSPDRAGMLALIDTNL